MRAFRIIVVSLFAAAAIVQRARSQAPERTWITDVSIISPEKLDRIETGSVLIENGRIARVDRRPGAKAPPGASVVSGKGQFLIPGLIDSHVHLTLIPGMGDEQVASKPEIIEAYFKQLPRSYLYYGFTTVVDPGVAVNHQRVEGVRRAPLHPDVYGCGDALPVANGYPMSFWPMATRFKLFPNFIYDPRQASSIPPKYKAEDHTVAAAISAVKRSGGICVKTFFERGFGPDQNLPLVSRDVFAEIRAAATRANLVLMIHANSFEAQRFGVDEGADVLAHGMWNWGALNGQAELPAEIKGLLDQIATRKIGYQPTVEVTFGQSAYFDPDYLKMPAIAKVIPAPMLDWFNSADGKWFKAELAGPNPQPDTVMLALYNRGPLRRERHVVAYLAGKDANFLFGTDTPSMTTYGNLPGLNGYLEIRQLQEAGMSLAQIFKALTISNARAFKLDAQLGSIEPGKVANLLLLTKSPLESVDAYDTITTVWVHGKTVSRDSLAADRSK